MNRPGMIARQMLSSSFPRSPAAAAAQGPLLALRQPISPTHATCAEKSEKSEKSHQIPETLRNVHVFGKELRSDCWSGLSDPNLFAAFRTASQANNNYPRTAAYQEDYPQVERWVWMLRGLESSHRELGHALTVLDNIASNGATWAFGGGVPMGNAGLGNPRPNNGPMTSFAQTIGGSSQAAAPLDLSEFPSLSNNQTQPSQSTWAATGNRNLGPSANLRMQPSALSSQQQQQQQMNTQQQTQQQQQDDLFNSSSQLPSNQGGFRFGNQNAVGQTSQPNTADEFPPLNRNANGEIGQDRGSNLIPNVGFGAPANGLGFGSANPPQPSRNNGLLNALSGSGRAPPGNHITPTGLPGASNPRQQTDPSQGQGGVGEDSSPFSNSQFPSTSSRENTTPHPAMPSRTNPRADGLPQHSEMVGSQSHTAEPGSPSSQDADEPEPGQRAHDPLAHMSEIDKWGLKGWSFMMNNFPDYSALVNGSSITNLGFDLTSPEPFSSEVYSVWDNEPSRPSIPQFSIPECYRVHNVNSLESKIQNFNDEALIFMFYSNPGDIQQVMAAQELHTRNWRYHKKLQQWLTKDDMMVPQTLGNGTERGYYIFFDIKLWQRERRELTLIYEDLESLPSGPDWAGGITGCIFDQHGRIVWYIAAFRRPPVSIPIKFEQDNSVNGATKLPKVPDIHSHDLHLAFWEAHSNLRASEQNTPVAKHVILGSDDQPPPTGPHPGAGRVGDPVVLLLHSLRAREADVERIQQMFPQVERRSIMWDLQRNGGNVVATTERVLSGRGLEVPPQSFQPPLPPPSASTAASVASKPVHPDLITRYNLKAKILEEKAAAETAAADVPKSGAQQAWSTNKGERQALLQRRREEMILAARRKMEAKVAAESALGKGA
ncbi:hypothetical protein HYFRA_00004881 [Hymenoscyphus fraxineus]|uniref:Coupling of ubiquitin conjugation to ER degradation protein 1 n=1 Tax=Hymenoscyphus fraxineus TaxID=746836 RepID=A0A9N9KLM8_9HELO|nr:hypothetical protein HYFRA_00004881 [Hymenoscyphus fraxineus]